MVEAASVVGDQQVRDDTTLDKQLFPENFFEAETFVAPAFSSVIDRYYQRFYKPIR